MSNAQKNGAMPSKLSYLEKNVKNIKNMISNSNISYADFLSIRTRSLIPRIKPNRAAKKIARKIPVGSITVKNISIQKGNANLNGWNKGNK